MAAAEFSPNTWIRVARKASAPVAGFVPFKTPLDPPDTPDEEFVFTAAMMKSSQTTEKGCRMKLVVNLDAQERYDTRSWDQSEVTYVHIPIEPSKEPPSDAKIKMFLQVCRMFLSKHPDQLVGVHDIYSYNLTGFLIACYLVEIESWGVHAAIEAFRKVRPPGIYARNWIGALFARFQETVPLYFEYPPVPEWDSQYASEQKQAAASAKFVAPSLPTVKKRPREESAGVAAEGDDARAHKAARLSTSDLEQFGVPSIVAHRVAPGDAAELFARAARLCKMDSVDAFKRLVWINKAPFGRDCIDRMKANKFFVTWKTKSPVYGLLLNPEGSYLLLESGVAFDIFLDFPKRNAQTRGEKVKNTLAVGELVTDSDKNSVTTTRFLITDVLVFEGHQLHATLPFSKRLQAAQADLIGPRQHAAAAGSNMQQQDSFRVRLKTFVPCFPASQGFAGLVRDVLPALPHPWTGLVFVADRAGGAGGASGAGGGAEMEGAVYAWERDGEAVGGGGGEDGGGGGGGARGEFGAVVDVANAFAE